MTDPTSYSGNPSDGGLPPGRLESLASRVGPSAEAVRRHPWAFLAAAFLAAAVSTALASYWIIGGLIHSRQAVTVPDLTGKNLETALDLLGPLRLSLAKDAVQIDENFPPGAILRQVPPAGIQVREGKVVHVTLSSGGQVLFVPELTGTTLTEAQNRLRSAGLVLGAMSQAYSTQKEAGWVMEQTPAVGAVIKPGSMVDLKVSKGPPPEGTTLMPDFINRPFGLARQWAKDAGVEVTSTEELSSTLPGLVLSQTPAPDTPLGEKAVATFLVAKSSSTAAADVKIIRYEIPGGTERVQVRIVLRDDDGEKEVYQSQQNAGSVVEVAVAPKGAARARIFVDGVLIEERPLLP